MLVYIDMDDVLCNYSKAMEESLKARPAIKFPQSQYGFFANLEPMENAVQSVQMLLNSDKITPYILTAPSINNPLCYTEKRVWIEKYLGMEMVRRLIISYDKGLLRGDILIDDYDSGRGQDAFQGELIQFGTEIYPDWTSVTQYLFSKV